MSSAIIASVYALAGVPASGSYPASYPYRNPTALNDLTSGSDGACGPAYLCTAQAGYDGPTGLGTPNGTRAFALGTVTGNIITPFLAYGSLNLSTEISTTLAVEAHDSGAGETPTLQFTATGLPTGMTIATEDCGTVVCAGVISGTPPSPGSYPVTVTATDSTGARGSITFTLIVTNAVRVYSPGYYQSSVVDTEITPLQIQGYDSAPGQTLTFTATGLPPGLSVASTGPLTAEITGTPSTLGTYYVTVTATDPTGAHGSVTFRWDIHGVITLTNPGNISDYAGTSVLIPVPASDSVAGATLTYMATGLPPGVGIPSSGPRKIAGWPLTPNTYHVTIQVSDQYGATAQAGFTWTVNMAPDTGPTGPVHLGLGGKCLDDRANSSANGTKIIIWSCNGSSAQNWTVVQDGTLRIHGKCLDTVNGGTTGGTKAVLEPCTGAEHQQWNTLDPSTLFISTGVHIALVSWASGRSDGMCLDDTGSSTVNGTQVEIWRCNGHTSQVWVLPAGPVASVVPGKCMDDAANGTANGNKIQLWSCNGSKAQNWRLRPDGTVRIHGKCLDVTARGTTPGTPLELWTCNGGANQRWSAGPTFPVPTVTGLQNPASGLCLADPGASTTNGTRLVIGWCATFNEVVPANLGAFWHIK